MRSVLTSHASLGTGYWRHHFRFALSISKVKVLEDDKMWQVKSVAHRVHRFAIRNLLLAGTTTLLALVALAPAGNAQVVVSLTPPGCAYGYYDYSPYGCAPMGFYGPGYFHNGIFLGVGPWSNWGYGHGWGEYRFRGSGGGRYVGGRGYGGGRGYAANRGRGPSGARAGGSRGVSHGGSPRSAGGSHGAPHAAAAHGGGSHGGEEHK
jgi:hypothetical protein